MRTITASKLAGIGLIVLGVFVDQVSMMLITLPFFMPLVQHFGWDPLWFGVIYLICMQLGLLLRGQLDRRSPRCGLLLELLHLVPKWKGSRSLARLVRPIK